MPNLRIQPQNRISRWKVAISIFAWGVTVAAAIPTAMAGFYGADVQKTGLASWIFGSGIDKKTAYFFWLDCSIPLFALCFIPLLFLFPVMRRNDDSIEKPPKKKKKDRKQAKLKNNRKTNLDTTACWLSVVVGICSLVASNYVSQTKVGAENAFTFGELPPAYHDEFSYILQAKTFADGKFSYPSHDLVPHIFDQMHVVNEGRFASRYFPGTGMWLAPFVAIGIPYFGQWLAGAISAVFFFWSGRELGGNLLGFLAGILTAISPGMALFSNLLLSHHATTMGLSLFLFCFLKWNKSGSNIAAALAGVGLSFAMLCRPMTAFAFGLPFGAWFLWKVLRTNRMDEKRGWQLKTVFAMGIPILLGFATMFVQNRAITGDGFVAPYQLFNEIYTPRHVYGFQNAADAAKPRNPAFKHYDNWAENLDASLAMKNLRYRLTSSWQWTLGFLPLLLSFLLLPLLLYRGDSLWWLIVLAVMSLHLVHIPYWFDGIMHWHYVFETGPLWLLLLAGVSLKVKEVCDSLNPWLFTGWMLFLVVSVLPSYWSVGKGDPLWFSSKLGLGVDEISMSRIDQKNFRERAKRIAGKDRILLLIEHDPTVQHIDYVVNDPSWDAQILYGRYRSDLYTDQEILKAFPKRKCYLYRVKQNRIDLLKPSFSNYDHRSPRPH